jgi:hypothetical protein
MYPQYNNNKKITNKQTLKKSKSVGSMAKMLELLPSKLEGMSSIPSTEKKNSFFN